MKGKRWITVVAVLVIVSMALAACGPSAPESSEEAPAAAPDSGAKYGGSLIFGTLRDPNTWDPHIRGGISHSSIPGNIYDTLLEYDLDGNFVGALAESWEQVDDTTYEFKLRQGVKFHDGSDFDVQDVLATMERIANPDAAAQHQKLVAPITFEAVDDYTLRATLPEPKATFLNMLADTSMWIMNAEDVGKDYTTGDNYNGTGPFTMGSWEPERETVLPKNPNYWKEGLPYLDELVLMPNRDTKARYDSLRSGGSDLIEYVMWGGYEELESEGLEVVKHNGLMSFIMLNVGKPPLDDVRVRQALTYIIDLDEINEFGFGGQGAPVDGPWMPKGTAYYSADLEGTYHQDWDKAKELLKEAGYDSPEDVPPITYHVTNRDYTNGPGQVVQQRMDEFGLTLEWEVVGDTPTTVAHRQQGTYQMFHDGRGIAWPDPDYLQEFFHSERGNGYAVGVGYKNERIDELLDQGAQSTDVEERKKIYHEVEELLLEDVPWLSVIWRAQGEAFNPEKVNGYVGYPSDLFKYNIARMEYVWLDE